MASAALRKRHCWSSHCNHLFLAVLHHNGGPRTAPHLPRIRACGVGAGRPPAAAAGQLDACVGIACSMDRPSQYCLAPLQPTRPAGRPKPGGGAWGGELRL